MSQADPGVMLADAHRALTAGDVTTASASVARLLQLRPDWPPAVHLAGLIARAEGDLSRAEDLMRRSLDLPGTARAVRAEYANNLGNLLRGAGYPAQAEAVFRLALDAAELPQARTGLARTLLEMDRPDEALTVLRALRGGTGGINATVLLSEALAQTGERQAAMDVLTEAGEQDLSRSSFWLALGARLGSLGRHVEAEAALRPLLSGKDAASALIALTDLRILMRDWQEALTFLREGVRVFPDHVELQTRLAGLEWMLGDGEHFADGLRRRIAARPQDRAMRLALVSLLANAGQSDAAEMAAREGLAQFPGDYHFAAWLATRCAETERPEEAQAFIATALAGAPELDFVREQAAIVSLVAGRIEAALEHTQWLTDRQPAGQTGWALRTLALRAAGDEQWRVLADPSRVCRSTDLEPPPGHASIAEFNRALAARLRARHTLAAHPLVNSVRNGTQIEIHPGSETDPLLRAFFDMIREPISRFIASMPPDPQHPLFRRKAGAYRLSGCWTVRLEGGAGHHVSHIHPRGWISSAYYVSVPEEITHHPRRAGWLSFGKPPYPIRGLEATAWVQPAVGRLALFPSYQWHAVESFPGQGERLSIAFDAAPIASGTGGS
jgi:tetratricopeptide (TPR) repeat protein